MKQVDKYDWKGSWKYHREELILWAVTALFYYLFVSEADPSKYKSILYFMSVFLPPFTAVRIILSAKMGRPIDTVFRKSKKDHESE